jgi:ammonium transporter, Amt family
MHSTLQCSTSPRRIPVLGLALFAGLFVPMSSYAQTPGELAESIAALTSGIDFVWTLIAAFMVFLMQAGFAMVESGFTRAKNAGNIMMKNLMDFSIGSLSFWLVGFAIMFGASDNGWIGLADFAPSIGLDGDQWTMAFLIFQTVFAATAATIVSGAVAERTKFTSYLIYSVFITALVYPVFGHWAWGNLFYDQPSWLADMGFVDFAGSTVVHSVGGWAALAGTIVLGPRLGKYRKDGRMNPIPGHNLPMAALGVFILWFGWFGFNAGSTTSGTDLTIAFIAVNTNLAAAAGALAAMITAWIRIGKPDVGMALNGALAGLVGITAGCANVSTGGAVIIGLIAGVLVVLSVMFFDRIKVDDPVGAISVHGVAGAWGTLAAAIFDITGSASIVTQLIGIATAFVWSFGVSFALFYLIKVTVGMRVSKEEEMEGLDYGEHAASAYPDFQSVSIH